MKLFGFILSGILAKDCWDKDNLNGYDGNISKSGKEGMDKSGITQEHQANGIPCASWAATYPMLKNSKCRNPDNDTNGPWCYHKGGKNTWGYCKDVPKCDKACSCTISGGTCQKWNSTFPHKPKARLAKFIKKMTDSNNNFCANPDNDPQGKWCYTTDPNKRFEYCSEKCVCATSTPSVQQIIPIASTTTKIATTKSTTTTTSTTTTEMTYTHTTTSTTTDMTYTHTTTSTTTDMTYTHTTTPTTTTTTTTTTKKQTTKMQAKWNSDNAIQVGIAKDEPQWKKLALMTPTLHKSTGAKTVRYGISDRIFGGALADTILPWQLGIQFKDNRGRTYLNCGGTLVSLRIGVTANHCIVPNAKWSSTVGHFLKWGQKEIGFQKRDVQKVIEHPEYKKDYRGVYSSRSHNNDIMMFVFESAFDYTDYVRPAALPIDASFKAPPGSKCIISGWGNTETGRATTLKLNVVPLTSSAKCQSTYGRILTEHMICGGSEGEDTCQGDSGGPLICMVEGPNEELVYTLIGVTSFGKGCGLKNIPGVYAEVADYLDWIHDAMVTYQ